MVAADPIHRARQRLLTAGAVVLGVLAALLYLARILLPNLVNEGLTLTDPALPWVCLPPAVLVAVAVSWLALRAYRAMAHRNARPAGWRSVTPGGLWDRHAIAMPALCFSIAWLPYVVIFFRRTIAFGDLGSPLPVESWGYWALLAFQLFVCVISHSLALRTIIRLYAPLWLIAGSIIFFCLSPIWGMLTCADVRHPLFAMMVCVLTSSVAFIVYGRETPRWLWFQLGASALLVALLRSTGIWCAVATLGALALHKALGGRGHGAVKPRRREAVTACGVLATVLLVFWLAAAAGWSLPLGEPDYGDGSFSALVAQAEERPFDDVALRDGDLVANDVPYQAILERSVNEELAQRASSVIYAQQELPIFGLFFSEPFYLLVFGFFLAFCVVRRDVRALLVGMPQLGILVVMAFVPADATLCFLLPVMAAQIMFFGALLRGVDVIGDRRERETALEGAFLPNLAEDSRNETFARCGSFMPPSQFGTHCVPN